MDGVNQELSKSFLHRSHLGSTAGIFHNIGIVPLLPQALPTQMMTDMPICNQPQEW